MAFNSNFSEAEMFLASLQSEDSSDCDRSDNGYDFFNTSPNQGASNASEMLLGTKNMGRNGISSGSGNSVAMNLTPESFNSYYDQNQASQQQSMNFGVASMPLKQMNSLGSASTGNTQNYTENNSPFDLGVDSKANIFNEPGIFGPIKNEHSPKLKMESDDLKSLMNTDPEPSVSPSGDLDPGSLSSINGKITKPKKERTSHNVIEKKYRTNINDKILQLREIVPSLRIASKREAGVAVTDTDKRDLDGLEPARKLNKASILIKTIEYIRHLENKCSTYKFENEKLKSAQGLSTPESVRNNSTGTSEILGDATQHAHGTPYSQAYPGNQGNSMRHSDLTGKFLMGGLALTMGASCFGEDNDFSTARGLMSVPVFHYSPMSGFTMSNNNGIVNLHAALMSLLRISLLMATMLHLMRSLWRKAAENKMQQQDHAVVQFSDTVAFSSPSLLWDTLKKTLFVNRLKYPVNSIERIESELAACFALKLYSLPFPFSAISSRYVASTWAKIKNQVELANKRNKGALNTGFEWERITHVLTTSREETLENRKLLSLLSTEPVLFSLKDFVGFVNEVLIESSAESVIAVLLQQSASCQRPIAEVAEKVYASEVFNNQNLKFSRESFTAMSCLLEASERNIDSLLKLIKTKPVGETNKSKADRDQIFVLYSAIVRNLLSNGKDKASFNWVFKVSLADLTHEGCSIVGVAAMYLMLRSLMERESSEGFEMLYGKLEELSGKLRVWLGDQSTTILALEDRGKLVDYCVETALKCGTTSTVELEGSTESEEFTDDDNDEELTE
ncbi:LAFE_0D08284g1_1 [Lachancea fermentati]|uniref:LAFE_0D08284g1_1 n=1 Tax=Lachancea fermentati TaxID=4955 RepID=A0A1G4MBR2_LACFM|nr:LAFE_0D08284g1_1 [Lachancea fermentati]